MQIIVQILPLAVPQRWRANTWEACSSDDRPIPGNDLDATPPGHKATGACNPSTAQRLACKSALK